MLSLYENFVWANPLQARIEEVVCDQCRYYASDLEEYLELDDEGFQEALAKAEKACLCLHIPLQNNLKYVFRYTDQGLFRDIRLSALLSYLVSINANPDNINVARMQLYFGLKH